MVGVNNIVIEPIIEQTEENLSESSTTGKEKKKFSPGLSLRDVTAISEVVPSIQAMSPEIVLETYIIKNGVRRSAKLVGVEPSYFELTSFNLLEGKMFNDQQLIKGSPVCIIGKSIQTRFFPTEDPIGKAIKCGPNWLTIIGVLEERIISESSIAKLGIRDFNMDVYTPIKSVLIRYENRDLVTKSMLDKSNMISGEEEESTSAPVNYHQIDKLVVQVAETELLNPVAEIVSRILERRHYEVIDYQITIPELL